ncbi:MAG: hypothetical protein JJ900_15705 [Rhodospirillales bacterium]|nr:hypothetical protein [Rhodospirillales bacterium]MBO6788293.1 hypothetical protein [Rhodospirillales bacterium]
MDDVYMTQCSLIRTYHQMDNAKRTTAPTATPSLFDWLKRLVARLRAR